MPWDITHMPEAQTLLCVPWTRTGSPSLPLACPSAVAASPGGAVRVPWAREHNGDLG